jgi:hypothetical protein
MISARAQGEDEYLIAMCMRVREIATEQNIDLEHVREILKEKGIQCDG